MTEEEAEKQRRDRLHEAIFRICDHYYDEFELAILSNELRDLAEGESKWRLLVPPPNHILHDECRFREYKTDACNRIADSIVAQFYQE